MMSNSQNDNARPATEKRYKEKYKPRDTTDESPTLSKDRFGFEIDNIDIPCKYARDVYIGYCVFKQKYETTLVDRKSYLRTSLRFLKNARETNILDITRTDLEVYVKYCIDERRHRKNTIVAKLNSIANLVKHIHTNCNPPSRPCLTHSMVKDIEVDDFGGIRPPIKRKPLSREEVTRLIDAAGNQYSHRETAVKDSRYPRRDKLAVRLLYETGLRNADLRGLKLEHFNYDEKVLIVEASKGDNEGTISYEIPVRDNLARVLHHWIEVGRPSFLGDKESEYIIPPDTGGKMNNNTSLCRIVKDAAERATLDGELGRIQRDGEERTMARVTPHVLRHSITSHLDAQSLDDELLKLLLGNVSTLDTYRGSSSNKEEFDQLRTTLHHLD